MIRLTLFVALIYFLSIASAFSQCLSAPPPDDCLGTEPSAADNNIITQGTTKWYYSAPAVFSQLTIRGGKLVICSDLTVNNFVMDSGIVVVRPGARLKIGAGAGIQLRGNCAIYNYGTLEVTSNLSLENSWASALKPNIFINASASAVLSMVGQYFVINNPFSYFVNRGKAAAHGIVTDPGAAQGSVCLYYNSQTNLTVLVNKSKYAFTAAAGGACLHINERTQLFDTLTKSQWINVCLGPTHVMDNTCILFGCKPNAWGTTNIFQVCNSCDEIHLLPLNNMVPTLRTTAFTVSPNPFYNNFRISWPAGKNPRTMMVTNLAGRAVFSSSIRHDVSNMLISLPASLPAGEYIVKLVYESEVGLSRILKLP